MKKKSFVFSLASSLLALTCLSGCSSQEEGIVLKVLNCEDYIGEDEFDFVDEDGNEHAYDDVLTGFEEYESAKLGKPVTVVYDTYDTNETMLSSLKTGKSTYDLIVASDYTVQKMMMMGMLQKIDLDRVPQYRDNVSPYLKTQLDQIKAEVNGSEESVGDYSLGYMWGTLGILYNPAKVASDKGMEEEEVKGAMNHWASLWDPRFKGEMSVKDSMRDTYSVGIMELFEEEIIADMKASNCFDENFNLLEGKWQEAVDTYNIKLSEIFNRCDEETVSKVKDTLLKLKENIFGFEVDSGKEDMVKGMIGMNLAWSGDAVFSMDTAEEGRNPIYIYYSVPRTGGNIWFDAWMMTKDCQGESQVAAYDFLDFVSNPQVAAANMNTIGYTSFIGGETVLDLVREWYDPRFRGDYEETYDEDGDEVADGAVIDGQKVSWSILAEDNEWSVVDLSYVFNPSSYLPASPMDTPLNNPCLLYTDELEEVPDGDTTCLAGRQFYAQYPPQELPPKLAIMKDYGENNRYILAMWQDVESNNLPLAGVIVFAVILLAASAFIVGGIVVKRRYHKLRVARRKEHVKNS